MNEKDHFTTWIGPVPCEEWHAGFFYGRAFELDDIIPRVKSQKLTIISAISGAGKTSLIRAGLMPALRLIRDDDPLTTGFALCVREWGEIARKQSNAARAMIESIYRALLSLKQDLKKHPLSGKEQLAKDISNLSQISPPDEGINDNWVKSLNDLQSYIGKLQKTVEGGRLIIVADQVEEFLGSGTLFSNSTLNIEVADVFESIVKTEGVRLVISLREEYIGKLRPLEERLYTMAPRLYRLQPLNWGMVRKIIKTIGQKEAGITMEDGLVDLILSWATFPLSQEPDLEYRDTHPIDMLSVQAFLWDIFTNSMGGKYPIGDEKGLKNYLTVLLAQEPHLHSSKYLAAGPMLRWIDKAFDSKAHLHGANLIKKTAANMGTVLSTPRGFKSYKSSTDLVFHAIKRDLTMEEAAKIDVNEIRCILANNSGIESIKENIESPKALLLVETAFEAIDILQKGNILKRYGNDANGAIIYALNHDGYAPAFTEWCEDPRRRQNDCLASGIGTFGGKIRRDKPLKKIDITDERNEGFQKVFESDLPTFDRLVEATTGGYSTDELRNVVFDDLVNITWNGCHVSDLSVRNVNFQSSNFTGSFFTGCSFEDCTFTDCNFDGSFFTNTAFTNVTFKNCFARGLVVRKIAEPTTWENVSFIDTNITSAFFQNIILKGQLVIIGCTAHFAQLFKFETRDGAKIRVTGGSLYGALFEDYESDNHTPGDAEKIILSPPPPK